MSSRARGETAPRSGPVDTADSVWHSLSAQPAFGTRSDAPLPGADARLNHYFTKSRSEYRKKRWRGRADKPKSWYADLRNESLWSARVDLRLVEQLALRYQHSRGREEKMLLHSLMQSLRNRSALPERAAAMLSAHCIATKSVACTWLGVGHAES